MISSSTAPSTPTVLSFESGSRDSPGRTARCVRSGRSIVGARSTSATAQAAPWQSPTEDKLLATRRRIEVIPSCMRLSGRRTSCAILAQRSVVGGEARRPASTLNEVVGTLNGRAFLVQDGHSYELGVLPGHASSDARAINNKGQVVKLRHRNRRLPRVPVESRLDAQPRSFAWRQLESGTGPQRRRGCCRTLGPRRSLGFSRRHLARRRRHGPEPADSIARLDSFERDGDQRSRPDCRRWPARRSGAGLSSGSAVKKNLRSTTW